MKRLRIIDRYILKEFFFPFTLGMFIFTFVLLISQSRRLMDMIVVGNVSSFVIIKMISCVIPSFLVLTLPMTVLLAFVMAFGRLSSDGEIVAMMASGITFKQLSKPVFAVSFIGYIATLFLNTAVVPKSNRIFRETVMGNVEKTIISNIQEGIFNDKMGDIVLYVKRVQANRFHGIFIADYRLGREKEPTTIFAREGEIYLDPENFRLGFLLLDGSIHLSEKKNKKRYGEVSFKKYRLRIDMDHIFSKKRKKFKIRREWMLDRLRYEIEEAKRKGENYLPMEVDLVKKFSLPVSCFILGILSLPLGINTERGNKMSGLPKCIALFIMYYMLWNAFENMAKAGVLNAYLALWMPNFIMGLIAAALFFRANKVSRGYSRERFEHLKNIIRRVIST